MAHPLAHELAARFGGRRGARVLLLGIGSGRNLAPLVAAGLRVHAVDEDGVRAAAAARAFTAHEEVRIVCRSYGDLDQLEECFSGALSTHALLHGSRAAVASAVSAVRSTLAAGAHFFATLGSTRDPRCGRGVRVAPNVFAPADGNEAGVAHVFYDERSARSLFAGFELESLHEESAAATVGAWAHDPDQARDIVHWFVRARRISRPASR